MKIESTFRSSLYRMNIWGIETLTGGESFDVKGLKQSDSEEGTYVTGLGETKDGYMGGTCGEVAGLESGRFN